MSRSPVLVRDAVPSDAAALVAIWADFSRRPAAETEMAPEVETANALARIVADSDERLVVAVIEDQVVGTMHMRRAPVSPIHTETAIHTSHLHVLPQWRRHGAGRALMEAAVSWAEEKDTGHVLAASTASSREANRFMARLGLGQIAVVRGATVTALRAKLPGEAAAVARIGTRPRQNLGQVVAHRRSLRRAQTRSD